VKGNEGKLEDYVFGFGELCYACLMFRMVQCLEASLKNFSHSNYFHPNSAFGVEKCFLREFVE
jgi:hypothetical protein